jgi:hypothetical protein
VTDEEIQTAVLATVIAFFSIETRKRKRDILQLCIELVRRRHKEAITLRIFPLWKGFQNEGARETLKRKNIIPV